MTVQDYKKDLADLKEVMEKFSKDHLASVQKLEAERKNGESVHLQKMQDWTDENVGKPMADFKAAQARWEDVIAKLEANKSRPGAAGADLPTESLAHRFINGKAFEQFREVRGQLPLTSDKEEVKSFWYKGALLNTKAPDLTMGETALGSLVVPWYRPGIFEDPKNMPILREFVPVIPLPVPTNLVKTDREASEELIATTLEGDVIATATTADLTSISGLTVTRPFNSIKFDDGTNSETVLISNINTVTNVVTFAPALANPYTAALTTISAQQFTTTDEGALKPQGFSTFEDYDIPVVTLAQWVVITKQKLQDIASIQDTINRRLLNRLARMEDLNEFYGDGNTGQMTGIFEDSDVPAMAAQTAGDPGEQEVDYLLDAYYDLAESNYTADLAIVRPATHKAITKLKGADGHYVYFTGGNVGAPQGILTMALRWSNQLVGTDAVVGQFSQACTIYDRMTSTIEVGWINDQMVKNKRTLLGEQRLGFGIERPNGLRTLNFNGRPATP